MQSNRVRARHYARQARESSRLAAECAKRGDAKGARSWERIAAGEREAADFWNSDGAPRLPRFRNSWSLTNAA